MMADRCLTHECHCQGGEYIGLNQTYKCFQPVQESRDQNRDQNTQNTEQQGSRENRTEKTQTKRKHLGKLGNEFKDTHNRVHQTKEGLVNNRPEVKELGNITKPQCRKTKHLHHHHRDERERDSKVQIGSDTTEEGNNKAVFFTQVMFFRLTFCRDPFRSLDRLRTV